MSLVAIANAVLAFAGSAAGGLLRYEPLATRVILAIGFGGAGLFAYLGLVACGGGPLVGLW